MNADIKRASRVRKSVWIYASLCGLVALLLCFGDPQWSKVIYIFRAYYFPGGMENAYGCGNYVDNIVSRCRLTRPENYTGVWRTWYKNGQLEFQARYIKGVVHGPLRSFCADGSKLYEFDYVHGLSEGAQIQYGPKGRKSVERIYTNGVETLVRHWDIDSNEMITGYFKNGSRHHGAFLKDCDSRGRITAIDYYEDGRLVRTETRTPRLRP